MVFPLRPLLLTLPLIRLGGGPESMKGMDVCRENNKSVNLDSRVDGQTV